MAYHQNGTKTIWSYLGSRCCWRRMFRPTGIIRQKSDVAFCKRDVEQLKNLSFHSVSLTHGNPPIGIPLSAVHMRVNKGPSMEIKNLAPSLVSFLEAAAANGCQDNGPKQKAFEVLQKALVTLTRRPLQTQSRVNLEVARSLDELLYDKEKRRKKTFSEEAVNVAIVNHVLQHLTMGLFVLNKAHAKVPRRSKQTYMPSIFNWDGLALGHRDAWYGELDMLVCPFNTGHPQPKVAVLFEKSDGDSDDDDDDAYEVEDDIEGFYGSNLGIPEASIAVEEKKAIPTTWSLFGKHFSQGYATAVTFSYVYHYTLSKSHPAHFSLIPTIQISPKGYQIFFYDCIQDVMLANNFYWSRMSMIYLWAFFHYQLFFPANLDLNLANRVSKFGYERSSGFRANCSGLLFGLSKNSAHWRVVEPHEGRMKF